MKKYLLLLLSLIFLLQLCACTQSYEKADEHAKKFITALLIRDEAAMKQYIHPDHIESTLPDDRFYETLEKQFLTVGHPLTSLSGVSKAKIRDMDDSMKCIYIARVNELFYTVDNSRQQKRLRYRFGRNDPQYRARLLLQRIAGVLNEG